MMVEEKTPTQEEERAAERCGVLFSGEAGTATHSVTPLAFSEAVLMPSMYVQTQPKNK